MRGTNATALPSVPGMPKTLVLGNRESRMRVFPGSRDVTVEACSRARLGPASCPRSRPEPPVERHENGQRADGAWLAFTTRGLDASRDGTGPDAPLRVLYRGRQVEGEQPLQLYPRYLPPRRTPSHGHTHGDPRASSRREMKSLARRPPFPDRPGRLGKKCVVKSCRLIRAN